MYIYKKKAYPDEMAGYMVAAILLVALGCYQTIQTHQLP